MHISNSSFKFTAIYWNTLMNDTNITVTIVSVVFGAQSRHDNILENHDDVIKWKHFPRYWPFVRGIHRSPGTSPHKGQWRGALMFSLICIRIHGLVNNREAGDLRCYRAHYDVTIMYKLTLSISHLPLFFLQSRDYQESKQSIISPYAKWPPFCSQHFQMHLHEWKSLYFDSNFTEVCS